MALTLRVFRPTAADDMATIGNLSNPKKMPCHSYSLPAKLCHVGGKLRKVAGSICSKCYAFNGCYVFRSTVLAMARRYAIVTACENDPTRAEAWVAAFVRILGRKRNNYFRWFDSGDIQSLTHLRMMAAVAERLPRVHHWLPTKEYGIVARYLREFGSFPGNMCVRVSAPMIDGPAPTGLGLPTSGVHTDPRRIPAGGFECRAQTNGGHCGECRACWHVPHTSYHLHR